MIDFSSVRRSSIKNSGTGGLYTKKVSHLKANQFLRNQSLAEFNMWIYNKCLLASSSVTTQNEINFVVINLFDGIQIKLDIKEYGKRATGYTAVPALFQCLPNSYSESQRVVIRLPNHLLSS